MNSVSVIIAAAGSGLRMNRDKLTLRLPNGKTVLENSIAPFLRADGIEKIIISAKEDCVEQYNVLFNNPKIVIVTGGGTRSQSVLNALKSVDTDIVLIHDGARPFVTSDIIYRVISETAENGSAVPALPVAESISENGVPKNREGYKLSQTPQGFNTAMLKAAYDTDYTKFTDEAALFYAKYKNINYIDGEEENKKITFPSDLPVSAGIGYDLHKLAAGRKLIIGGVEIEYGKGLLGHSDADVLVHAVMNALLSAAGLRDIGYYFPDTDSKYENIDSFILLNKTLNMIGERGFTVNNVSATIIAQQPKLQPYIPQMSKNLAKSMSISQNSVGITATTNEGIGDIGEGNAIAASAIVTVIKIS